MGQVPDDQEAAMNLLPCPFCGLDEPDHCDEENRNGTWNYYQCRDVPCQAQGPRELSKEKAAEQWNRRTPSLSEPSQTEAALREALDALSYPDGHLHAPIEAGPELRALDDAYQALLSSPAPKASCFEPHGEEMTAEEALKVFEDLLEGPHYAEGWDALETLKKAVAAPSSHSEAAREAVVKNLLERNGGPLGGYVGFPVGVWKEDSYVMVRREDFDALAALAHAPKPATTGDK
jgi:Lar family restriction alleviation protein